jgi:hypothetical protein
MPAICHAGRRSLRQLGFQPPRAACEAAAVRRCERTMRVAVRAGRAPCCRAQFGPWSTRRGQNQAAEFYHPPIGVCIRPSTSNHRGPPYDSGSGARATLPPLPPSLPPGPLACRRTQQPLYYRSSGAHTQRATVPRHPGGAFAVQFAKIAERLMRGANALVATQTAAQTIVHAAARRGCRQVYVQAKRAARPAKANVRGGGRPSTASEPRPTHHGGSN